MDLKKIKKKEKKEKMPKVRLVSQKKANKALAVFAGVLLLFSTIGTIRSNVLSSNMNNVYSKIENLGNDKNKISEKESINLPMLSYYATNFMNEYITIDSEKKEEEQEQRLKKLADYLSFDVEQLDEKQPEKLVRTLKSSEVINVNETAECFLVTMQVSYHVSTKDVKADRSEKIVLPIQTKDNLYSLVSRPYVISEGIPQGRTKALSQVEKSLEIDSKDKESIEKFLQLFFTKYAENNKEELLVLMKEPEFLGNNERFKEIEKGSIQYFNTEKENMGVQLSVVFEDKETKILRTENFSLWITKTENSYFINTLKHYFTESGE
ncbi:conjugal transfer protein [Enterococcus sp. LJL51]|uniref:conjugal transfer protein n=1 Tax=Enterococcus sp. LJL51 TaxID=3416656 RepID=UPI003CF1297D